MTDLFGEPWMTDEEQAYRKKVRASCVAGIQRARNRQANKEDPALVDLTKKGVTTLLQHQSYLCQLTRQRFWQDDSDRFGPAMPSIDRIDPDGPYSLGNVRIVLHGINSLRGRGSDKDMYRIARALLANER